MAAKKKSELVMLAVRVPRGLAKKLKVQAAEQGFSLQHLVGVMLEIGSQRSIPR